MSSILTMPVIADKALLNPNSDDGCWDILFMICRGTGITPMLQLVNYPVKKKIIYFKLLTSLILLILITYLLFLD